MINIFVDEKNLEYDIYALLKAFYPKEEVLVKTAEKGHDNADKKESGGVPSFYDVHFDVEKVYCSYTDNGRELIREEETHGGTDKADIKNAMKRCIYRTASKVTGNELPWGTLTGIRPVKLAMNMICEGRSHNDIYDFLKNTYYVSDEKIRLATDIAGREKSILECIDAKNGYSLYIGIPFCPTTCLYCSFTSYPIAKWRKRVSEYLTCLKKEIDLVRELYKGKTPDTIYIGGGTPTTLEPEQLRELIGYLNASFNMNDVIEFTVEAGRPDSITREKLNTLKELGVSRISVNPQTMNDETLKVIGRRHTVDDVKSAFALARECGFDNINTDVILGLPGEDLMHIKHTMDEIRLLAPDSLTVHSMAIKRAAGMDQYLKEHTELKSINTPDMLDIAANTADELSMKPYYLYRQKNMTGNFENVGYAREGCYGIYNILIMEEVQSIIACGAGTVSKRVFNNGRIERCDNVKDVELYMSRLDEMLERKRTLFGD